MHKYYADSELRTFWWHFRSPLSMYATSDRKCCWHLSLKMLNLQVIQSSNVLIPVFSTPLFGSVNNATQLIHQNLELNLQHFGHLEIEQIILVCMKRIRGVNLAFNVWFTCVLGSWCSCCLFISCSILVCNTWSQAPLIVLRNPSKFVW